MGSPSPASARSNEVGPSDHSAPGLRRLCRCETWRLREDPMDPVSAFNERLRELTGQAITDLASALRHELDTAEGELAWWKATIAVSAVLKRHHRSREAGLAAHTASVALLDA